MLSMLLAYDADGNVIATLDYMVARDQDGLIDFDSHERGDGEMLDVWHVSGAAGSKVWPEWLGSRALDFRVEREGPAGQTRVTALVHRRSGHRRERARIEAAIQRRISEADGRAADIRDLVGGPDRPLRLDDDGRVRPPRRQNVTKLPVVAAAPN